MQGNQGGVVDESRDELRDLGDLQARVDEELPPPERRSKPRAEFKPPPIYLPEPHMMAWLQMAGKVVTPPKRPLSLDILAYVLGFLWKMSDMRTLNSIRLTSRLVSGLVEKQVVYAHNDYNFDGGDDRDHRRFAKVLALVLQNPSAHFPLFHTLFIPGIHIWHQDSEGELWSARPCICVSLLVNVLQNSRFLRSIGIYRCEMLLMADSRLADALAASSSLRALDVVDGFGPRTMHMFRQLGPGVRELRLVPGDSGDWEMRQTPLMTAFRGLRTSLEKPHLFYDSYALDIGVHNTELIWPHVHSLELASDMWASAPELAHAFPNLRHLEVTEEDEDVAASRARNQSMGPRWTSMDDVRLPLSTLCASALSCRMRRLAITSPLEDISHAQFLIEDLPVIQPETFILSLLMASDRPEAENVDDEAAMNLNNQAPFGRGGIEMSLAGRVLNALSGIRVLVLTVSGQGTRQALQADDHYINTLALTLNMPVLEYLRLHLHHPSPRLPLDNQLSKHLHACGKRALVEIMANSAPSLRHVFVHGWSEFDRLERGHLWDILRPKRTTLELREMPWQGIHELKDRFEHEN